MSKTIEKKRKMVEVLTLYTCDRCNKKIICDEDIFEEQEMLHLNFVGGYESVFGDGTHVSGDFCQNCVKELLGPFLKCRYEGE